MLTSEFSKKGLESLLRQRDLVHYPFARNASHRANYLETVEKRISVGSYDFLRLREKTIRHFKAYRTQKLGDELVLRRLAEVVRNAYRLKQSDRSAIVSQVQTLLTESTPKYVLRLDLASFYESINRDHLIEKLKKDRVVSLHSVWLVHKFFNGLTPILPQGLPRGLSISAALSELYLIDLDTSVTRQEGVYYYARYVDDIIIFSTLDADVLRERIRALLPPGMTFNEKKCHSFQSVCRCSIKCVHAPAQCTCVVKCKCKHDELYTHRMEYVGYSFSFGDVPPTSSAGHSAIQIGMADRKIMRIKTRVVLSFLSHIRTPNYELLKKRIIFLTENQRLRRVESKGRLQAGIYYNYPLITNYDSLTELDSFLKNILFSSKSTFGKQITKHLTNSQRKELLQLSFASGFRCRRSRRWTSGVVGAVRRCWKHV